MIIGGPQPRPRAPPRPDDRKPFDHFLCRPADLCGCPQSRLAEDGAAQAADDFLSAAEALADPTALRMPDDTWPRRHSLRSPGRKVPGTTTNRNSRRDAAERHRAGRARRGGVSCGEKKPR